AKNVGSPSDAFIETPVCFLTPQEVVNSSDPNDTNGILTRPFGYPYSSKYYRLPKGPDELSKKMHEIKNTSRSWSMVDADQQNSFPGGYYYTYLPTNKVHGAARNTMFFDWHVDGVKD